MTTALVMAGGRGERLRASGGTTPKPLVPIRGLPLLERNLLTLLHSGFHDIVAAVPSHTPEIARFVRSRCRALADAVGAELRVVEESQPLGNIGAAAEVEPCDRELLVIYADNLTSLDLTALVRHHRHAEAALTCAVHLEPFRIPFGEVMAEAGKVVAYLEKPERQILIASGVFVLSSDGIAHLPRGQRTEVAWLANHLIAEGASVSAFRHEAPWIDVNDSAAVARAEHLVGEHPEVFECRGAPPDDTVVSLLLHRSSLLLLERRSPGSARYPDTWDLPGTTLAAGQSTESALEAELEGLQGVEVVARGAPSLFDDLDPASHQVYRHIVFPLQLGDGRLPVPVGRQLRFIANDRLDGLGTVSPAVTRALAIARLGQGWGP